jgi:2-oxoglutarate ferredoxin oxidoreductase subunit delta
MSNHSVNDQDQQRDVEPGQTDRESSKSKKKRKQYEIDIFRDWCKSCGICVAFCPQQCIQLDEEGSPVVTDPDRCTGCGWCELHCPDFAISVRPKKTKKVQEED